METWGSKSVAIVAVASQSGKLVSQSTAKPKKADAQHDVETSFYIYCCYYTNELNNLFADYSSSKNKSLTEFFYKTVGLRLS
mgnify:CR=1 FL=1